jgi:predicted RNA-binding protein with PUA-like domain
MRYLERLIQSKMSYWLVKSEPFKYSWEQFVKDGQTFWDGVRNYAARNHLRTMKKGDQVLFYHSNEGLEVVGIAKVAKEAYQDPTTEETAWVVVDLKPFKKLKRTVTLKEMKKEKMLSNVPLIRIPRLSVMPLTELEFSKIIEMSERK